MNEGLWIIGGLAAIMGLVLVLPFSSKKVEKELEAFLFIMGVLAVSISKLWSWHLVKEALIEPIKITLAVFVAGLLFRLIRPRVGKWTTAIGTTVWIQCFVFYHRRRIRAAFQHYYGYYRRSCSFGSNKCIAASQNAGG